MKRTDEEQEVLENELEFLKTAFGNGKIETVLSHQVTPRGTGETSLKTIMTKKYGADYVRRYLAVKKRARSEARVTPQERSFLEEYETRRDLQKDVQRQHYLSTVISSDIVMNESHLLGMLNSLYTELDKDSIYRHAKDIESSEKDNASEDDIGSPEEENDNRSNTVPGKYFPKGVPSDVLFWESIIAADGDDFPNIDDRSPASNNLIIKTAQRIVDIIEEDCSIFGDSRSLSQRRDLDVSYTGYTHQYRWKNESYRWSKGTNDSEQSQLLK